METIKEIEAWFKKAVPEPNERNLQVQLGCHFEEVAEMLSTMMSSDEFIDNKIYSHYEYTSSLSAYLKNSKNCKIDFADKKDLLDALCDQIVTAIGVGHMLGFDMLSALKEVNASNWSKFDENGNPIFDVNGKIKKGEKYFKPDLAKFAGEEK